ncbi:MAG: mechanosensitive ion channel [Coriobacteriia bacterium]|nr:mechanosensitive ion channel [Coriobacteriia bacterium]
METSATPHASVQLLSWLSEVLGSAQVASVVTAVLILIATAIICRLAVKALRRLLSRDNSPLPSSSIFVNILRVVMWALGLSVVLSTCCGVDVSAAVTALGVGGIALSLGFQDTLSNLIGGLQLSVMGIVQPGDHLEINGTRGTVKDVTWRHVLIHTATGADIVVPNSVINKASFTKLPPQKKVVVNINVSKGNVDLTTLKQCMMADVLAAFEGVATLEKEPIITFDAATEYGFSGTVVVWVEPPVDLFLIQDTIIRAVAPYCNPPKD